MSKLEIVEAKKVVKFEKKKRIFLEDCEVGDVIAFADGVTGLVIKTYGIKEHCVKNRKSILLLRYSDGCPWYQVTSGIYLGECGRETITRILGKLSKIEYTP